MDRVLGYFEACTSPQERSLARLIDLHGGPEDVGRNEELLQMLFRSWISSANISRLDPEEQLEQRNAVDTFRQLQREVHTDVQIAVRENLAQFQAKFSIQQREIEAGLDQWAHREGAVRARTVMDDRGARPHDRLTDPVSAATNDHYKCFRYTYSPRQDMYEIWDQMARLAIPMIEYILTRYTDRVGVEASKAGTWSSRSGTTSENALICSGKRRIAQPALYPSLAGTG